MDDLDAAVTADVQEFFALYYAPNNATLVVVGDFETAEARALIEAYFGDIPRGAEPAPVECAVTFGALGGSTTFDDQHANLPAVVLGFLIPPHPHADTPALSMLGTILGGGESSRLNIELDLVAVRDLFRRLRRFKYRESDVDRVTQEDAGERLRHDARDARGFDR